MFKSKIVITLIIIFCLYIAIHGQRQKNFVSLTVENGLSSNTVNSFAQDSLGFLWIATTNGLNRYDASKFKTYKMFPNNPSSLRSNNVYVLLCSKENDLYVGTLGGGLAVYNREKDNFENYLYSYDDSSSISSNNVRGIFQDKKGRIWIGSENGLNLFDKEKKIFKRYYFNFSEDYNNFANQIWCINQTSDSILWLGTFYGLIKFNIISGDYEVFKSLPDDTTSLSHNFIFSIENLNDSVLFLGSYNGLNEFDVKTRKNKRIHFSRTNDKQNHVASVKFFEDKLWCATKDGLVEYDFRAKNFTIYKNNIIDKRSIISNRLISLFVDDFGSLWIGSEEGLSYYDQTRYKFFDITKFADRELYENLNKETRAIIETHENEIWIGTSEGIGILNYLGEKVNLIDEIDKKCKKCQAINVLFEDSKHRIWVGTENGIFIYESKTKRFNNEIKKYLVLPHPNITKIYEYPGGNFWIGTNGGGLLNFNENKKNIEFYSTFYEDKKLASDFVTDIIAYEDDLLVGSYNNGVTLIDLKTGNYKFLNQATINLPSNYIYCFKVNNDNELLIGTANGLYILYPKIGNYETVIPGEMIKGIEEDEDGYFWLAVGDGIIKFSDKEGVIQKYTIKDGLLSQLFVERALYKGPSGIIYIGTSNGLNYFVPERISQNIHPPKLALTNISLIGDLTGEIERYFLGRNVNLATTLNLPYNKNYLLIEWATIHFTFPEKNISRYKLEGYDEGWISAGNRNLAIYSNLPPGSYVFRVQAANSDGIWSKNELRLKIEISPPVWKTTPAYIFYTIAIISFLYGLVWYTNYRKQKEIDILTKADKIKDEFLAQMSHEIRTPISAILSFTKLIKEDVKDYLNDELKESFEIIDSAGRRIMRTVDLILSMSEVKLGTYKARLENLDLYPIIYSLYNEYKNRAKEKNLQIELINECHNSSIIADSFTVSKIFDNLLDNAIKFTNQGKIQIKLKQEENKVAVEVADTGIGISEDYLPHLFEPFSQEETGYTRRFDGNGLGLALVKKYCELNNAIIDVESKKGVGSRFIVKFNLNAFDSN